MYNPLTITIMKNIVFRFNEGLQPYLYDCYILPEGYAPIELCKNDFFGDVICALAFLVNPQSPDVMGDMELAKHLLEIANSTSYEFTVKVWDVKEFLEYNDLLK